MDGIEERFLLIILDYEGDTRALSHKSICWWDNSYFSQENCNVLNSLDGNKVSCLIVACNFLLYGDDVRGMLQSIRDDVRGMLQSIRDDVRGMLQRLHKMIILARLWHRVKTPNIYNITKICGIHLYVRRQYLVQWLYAINVS